MKHTLILGSDPSKKDNLIHDFKKKLFNSAEQERFDCETLYGNKLAADSLKQALISLPAVARKKLLILRELKKLSVENQKLLLWFLDQPFEHMILIADGDGMESTTAFIKKCKLLMDVVDYSKTSTRNIFDVTNALSYGKRTEALKALSVLMSDGQHPLQLMGGLIWFWGKQKARLSPGNYKKGLLEIQEADMSIKRSRLKAEYVLEILVTKMSLLMQS